MNKPKVLQQLEDNIRADIKGLNIGSLSKVMQSTPNFYLCVQLSIRYHF